MRTYFLVFIFSFLSLGIAAQTTQTIRGSVVDKVNKQPLIGASVILIDSTLTNAVAADVDGNFRISNVPLGRRTIRINYLGYKEAAVTVVVTSGKEIVLNLELEESVVQGREVNIVVERRKDVPLNQMTTVSARSFTIEETQRYAGSLNDPSRMAANYAGVSGANDSRNDIIIRGNSPLGVLWRLNGIDIPNPNHFGSLGSTGGPVSILNNNVLTNSDFITSAFPAEYGNANAGVFDLKMRTGNNEKFEFLGQVGFNGFELGAEGPLSKKNGATFLLNYRYSTLGVFKALGINFGTGSAVPQYQDVSFNIDIPTKKLGKFNIFGLGGISYVEVLDKDRDTTQVNLYGPEGRTDGYFGNNMGAIAISNLHFFNLNTYGKLTLSLNYAGESYKVDSISTTTELPYPTYRNNSYNNRYSANYFISKKISSRDNIKAGITLDNYHFSLVDSFLTDAIIFQTGTNSSGSASLVQSYIQLQHKFTDKLSVTAGIHHQYFQLNESSATEPRVGFKYAPNDRTSFSLGAGLHHQIQPFYAYFYKTPIGNNNYLNTNANLDFSRSVHYVAAFDKNLGNNVRIKSEVYYQDLSRVPVMMRLSHYSLINEGADFGVSGVDSLVNKGTGFNYGLELTLEKFYSKGYYFLFTTSLFESKYKGSDNVLRNTAFNGNYVLNVLGGKEWTIKKQNTIAINIKSTLAGGRRYIPIDFAASALSGSTEYLFNQAYEQRFKDYFRSDIKFSYRINKKRLTHEISLDINNVLGIKNIFQQRYDPNSNSLITEYQIGFFPIPQYRILF
ncbi:MAG: hypothetical protein RIQ89_2058 [Bacteroidota bacterium]|jgi:hypothetical protein